MSVAAPDLTKPKPTEVISQPGRIQVESPEGRQQQMINQIVPNSRKIVPTFTAEQAHPQSADISLQQNPRMQEIGAVVKDENGFPFTHNDAGNFVESIKQEIEGEPSKGRAIRALEWIKTLGKRNIGKKNAGPAKVIKVGE